MRVRYADGRPAVVPGALTDLAGPQHGRVRLPSSLEWSSDREFDVDDDSDLRLLYETVLREARRPDDISRFVDAALLNAVWPRLWLPQRVRHAWESSFPTLNSTAA